METTPDLVEPGEETSEEVSSPESPPEEEPEAISPQTKEEFEARVERLCAMMEADPKVRDRIIAETYVNIASAEMGIRGMFEAMQAQGIAGLMKGALRRGG